MDIKTFYHKDSSAFTYIVYSQQSKDAVIIDPVLDYDKASSKVGYQFADDLVGFIKTANLNLHYIIETHIHADHLSSAQYIKSKFPHAKTAISTKITTVQKTFKEIYNFTDLLTDGSQFDCLLNDGEEVKAGSLNLKIIHTAGHTPTCMSILVEGCLFTGDSLFIPDFGTGRCDFPNGSAEELFLSVSNKLYTLPDETRVFVGHDYQPNGRELRHETSILESKNENIQLTTSTSKDEFVAFRTARDKQLSTPALLLPSIQVNIQAGHLPIPESNGVRYLKIPITES
ncbi:MAG: glyoxylase-like metal-dependent hydrolase (beta-lactamase superfamily II) [Enterobacterales bacterium]|jgi:glyoxylase-like metal-dependent hydrolase (beta-lactamase superfamily II)